MRSGPHPNRLRARDPGQKPPAGRPNLIAGPGSRCGPDWQQAGPGPGRRTGTGWPWPRARLPPRPGIPGAVSSSSAFTAPKPARAGQSAAVRSWSGHVLGARQSRPSITRGTQLTPSAPQMSSSSYSHAYRCRCLSGRPVRDPLAGNPAPAGPASGAPVAEAPTAPGDRGRAPGPGTSVCRGAEVWMNSGSPEAIRSPAFPRTRSVRTSRSRQ
jgi:hypothetical protein